MPLYEKTLSLRLPHVDVVPFDVGTAYPYPRLEVSADRREDGSVRAVILDNGIVQAAVLPDLGGRILFPFDGELDLRIEPGGSRGARMFGGIELSLDGAERLSAMGLVEIRFEDEEDGDVAVLIAEHVGGMPLSWHMRVSLAARQPDLRLDVKVFNRDLVALDCQVGLLGVPDGRVAALPGVMHGAFRNSLGERLGPRQTDSWTCHIFPSSFGDVIGLGNELVGSWTSGVLRILPREDLAGSKVLLSVAGETLEAKVDFVAGETASFPLGEIDLDRVAVMGPQGLLADWGIGGDPEIPYVDAMVHRDAASLRRSLKFADNRGATYVRLAQIASLDGRHTSALELLEDALGVNAEDPLAWWMRAAILRHSGMESEAELLNAHFLAPTEPMLRAEAYLFNPSQEKAANPLVRPLAEDPDIAVEVAVQLHEAGFWEDLAKWVDECQRHRENPMLRYILADALLRSSRMRTEAASHVQAVSRAPINPPYPWRRVEREVLERLRKAFPNDVRIEALLADLVAHQA